jgi:hypothetical protein
VEAGHQAASATVQKAGPDYQATIEKVQKGLTLHPVAVVRFATGGPGGGPPVLWLYCRASKAKSP